MSGRSDSQKVVEWRWRVSRFERAALSVADFFENESVSAVSFYLWRRKLVEPPGNDVVTHSGFLRCAALVRRESRATTQQLAGR